MRANNARGTANSPIWYMEPIETEHELGEGIRAGGADAVGNAGPELGHELGVAHRVHRAAVTINPQRSARSSARSLVPERPGLERAQVANTNTGARRGRQRRGCYVGVNTLTPVGSQ